MSESGGRPAHLKKSELVRRVAAFLLIAGLLVLLALFLSLFASPKPAPQVDKGLEQAKVAEKIRGDFALLTRAIVAFEEEAKAPFAGGTQEPLIPRFLREVVKDPWGSPYDLSLAGEAKGGFIQCAGTDKAWDTPDDLRFAFKMARLQKFHLQQKEGKTRLRVVVTFPAELAFHSGHLLFNPSAYGDLLATSPVEISADKKEWFFDFKSPPDSPPATLSLQLRGVKTTSGQFFASNTVLIGATP